MLSARRERELDRGNCGRPQSAGRLRSRTATRLNGDPQDLIRAMPAKGDRPAGPCLGGESRCNVTTRSPAGGSSCGRPRLARPAAWSAPAPGRTGRAGAPQPGRARRRQRRGPGRRPDRGSAGSSPRPARSWSPPTLACRRRWRLAHGAGRLIQPRSLTAPGGGPCRPVPEGAERSAAGADRGGGELRRLHGCGAVSPARAVTAGPALLLHRWLQQSAGMAPVSHAGPAGKPVRPGASAAARGSRHLAGNHLQMPAEPSRAPAGEAPGDPAPPKPESPEPARPGPAGPPPVPHPHPPQRPRPPHPAPPPWPPPRPWPEPPAPPPAPRPQPPPPPEPEPEPEPGPEPPLPPPEPEPEPGPG